MRKLLHVLIFLLLTIQALSQEIDWARPSYTKTYPIANYNQSKPESAWGCIYARDISTRVVNNTLVAVNVYKINTLTASPGAGPFSDVSQTFAVDYNRDGFADIISVTYGGRVVIKENKGLVNNDLVMSDVYAYNLPIVGDGTFVIDDFDNDRKLDLLLYNAHQQAVFIPDCVRNVPWNQMYRKDVPYNDSGFVTNWTVSAMASYDFDSDGYKDIIYADMRGRVWFWKNTNSQGNSRFFSTQFVKLIDDPDIGTTASNGGGVLDVADVNKDGVPDIIAGNTDKRGIYIYLGRTVNNQIVYNTTQKIAIVNNNGSLGQVSFVDPNIPNSKDPSSLPSFGPTVIKVTDVDRDGLPDIFVGTDAWRQGKNFGGSVYLFRGRNLNANGVPNFVSLELVRGSYSTDNKPPFDFDAGTIGDLDNDGVPDFVAADGNHSGNYYKIITQTVREYKVEDGIMVSDQLVNVVDYRNPDGKIVVGIPKAVLQNNFVKAIEVEIEFLESDTGTFELRYSAKSIKDPALIDHRLFGLMLDSSTMQPMRGNMPVPGNRRFAARVVLNTPSPDPQVIIVLRPKNKNEAPHIKSLTYKIWTTPAVVVIRGFNWTK